MPTVHEAITQVASASRADSVMARFLSAGYAEEELETVDGVFMTIDVNDWSGPDKAAVQRVRDLAGMW
jgi:hypothetical protein